MKSLLERSNLVGMALLVGAGLIVGLVGNLTAGPTRKLDWGRDYPAKGKPNCPETLPVPGATAAEPMTLPAASTPVGVEPTATPEAAATPAPMGEAPEHVGGMTASAPAATSFPAAATAVSLASPIATAVAPPPPPPAASADIPPVPPDKPWLELGPAQVAALYDAGALFVDARMTSQYQEGHVAGALLIAIWESGVDEKVQQVVFEVSGDKAHPIVVYCNGGDCEDSHNLGQKLWEAGHSAVYVYKDGYPDWVKQGRPVRKGSDR